MRSSSSKVSFVISMLDALLRLAAQNMFLLHVTDALGALRFY